MERINMLELQAILSASEEQLFAFLGNELDDREYTIITDNLNYLLAIPKADPLPVVLSAHLDTKRHPKKDEPMDIGTSTYLLWNRMGILGADDRAGIYIALEIMRRAEKKPYLFFPNFEEVGAIGTKQAIEDKVFEPYLKSINAFVGLDRRGFHEVATYASVDKELLELCESYGYHRVWGTFTDVGVLEAEYKISAVNFSVGFQDEHTPREYLLLPAIPFAIDSIGELIKDINKQYTSVAYRSRYSTTSFLGASAYPGNGSGTGAQYTNAYLNVGWPKCTLCDVEINGRSVKGRRFYQIQGHLCEKCERRVRKINALRGGDINIVNVSVAKTQLELERARTREANARNNDNVSMPAKVCPRCNDSRHTNYKKHTQSMYCEQCKLPYWVIGDKRFWRGDDKAIMMYEAPLIGSSITGIHQISDHPHFFKCAMCGWVGKKYVSISEYEHVKEGKVLGAFPICNKCLSDFEYINGESLKTITPPWEER